MPECFHCSKSILLHLEPKQKFTTLGGLFYHSKCYVKIHEIADITKY